MKTFGIHRVLLILCGALGFFSGCSNLKTNPLLSQDNDSHFAIGEIGAIQNRLEQAWQDRHNLASLNSFIELAQHYSLSNLGEQKWMVRLSRAFNLRAEYFQIDPKLKQNDWEMGLNWAEKALTLTPEYRSRILNQKLPPELAMDSIPIADLDALYWYAINLGRWAANDGAESVLKYKGRIKKIFDYLVKKSPDLNLGGVYRYYAAYYASLPGFGRMDLELSHKYFEIALNRFPQFFYNHTLYAEAYALKIKDTALYESQLQWVIKANPKSIKDYYPEQLLEQNRAGALLKGRP